MSSMFSRERLGERVLANPASRELITRYIPGTTVVEALPAMADMVNKGLAISAEYLSARREKVEDNVAAHLDVVSALGSARLAEGAEITVDPATLGIAERHGVKRSTEAARKLCQAADELGASVTLHMGPASITDRTIKVWKKLRNDWPRTGITLQADLLRTPADLDALLAPDARIRIVKGAYLEPRRIAHRHTHDTDIAFARAIRTLLDSSSHPLIATHDPRLISIAERLVRMNRRERGSYEFQMDYGIRPLEQRRLADVGHVSRVHVPFGAGWIDYYLDRLTDRPATVRLFVRSMVKKR